MTTKQLPRIAVLMPAYKAEATVPAALRSLAANNEPHDIVIIDDCSPVNLADRISPQSNLTILRSERNLGATGAAIMGTDYILSKGYEYIARLDADDISHPSRLVLQREYMDAHPEVGLLGSCGRFVTEEGETILFMHHPEDHSTLCRNAFYNNPMLTTSMMFRASALRDVGHYDLKYEYIEDYAILRLIASKYKLATLQEYLVDYTVSSKSISVTQRNRVLKGRLQVQWAYRDFTNIHFYLGIAKTLGLWIVPRTLLTSIKKRMKDYQQVTVKA